MISVLLVVEHSDAQAEAMIQSGLVRQTWFIKPTLWVTMRYYGIPWDTMGYYGFLGNVEVYIDVFLLVI